MSVDLSGPLGKYRYHFAFAARGGDLVHSASEVSIFSIVIPACLCVARRQGLTRHPVVASLSRKWEFGVCVIPKLSIVIPMEVGIQNFWRSWFPVFAEMTAVE